MGLYFLLNGQIHLPGDSVLIFNIGEFFRTDPEEYGLALVCVTININTQCCRNIDGGNVGEWFYPNGTIVIRNSGSFTAPFTRSGSTHQVRLNRRFGASGPVGRYECRVPDSNGVEQVGVIHLVASLGEFHHVRNKSATSVLRKSGPKLIVLALCAYV